jgi:hypothetical protein
MKCNSFSLPDFFIQQGFSFRLESGFRFATQSVAANMCDATTVEKSANDGLQKLFAFHPIKLVVHICKKKNSPKLINA